jgi:hypothetical protein
MEMFEYFGSVKMEIQSTAKWFGFSRLMATRLWVMAFGLFAAFAAAASSAPLSIHVVAVKSDGTTIPLTTGYRWTVEEDATKLSVPGQAATAANYSFSFHTSYMPVVAAGRVGTVRAGATADPDVARLYAQLPPDLDTGKRYYVSVAAEGYQMGGAPVVFDASGAAASATVYVNQYNLPAAQVSVFAFNDNNPINGAPDLPQEHGLAGFTVQLFEAGGTYGQSGGQVTQDGFGNTLGTTYNTDGSVQKKGNGIVLTGADGTALIKNLFPAKYTVVISPPVNTDWHQTSTIEGTRGSDAWVKNNEPSFFQEFGPPGHHVFIGFTHSGKLPVYNDTRADPITPCAANTPGCQLVNLMNGSHTITGRIVNVHNSRTPNYAFEKGAPVPECWVGLNETNGATRALYATPCKKDSTFSIPNVPNGTYELVVWDDPLDMIIGTQTVCLSATATPGCSTGALALGDVPVFSWFGRYQGRVFQDINGTGLPFFAEDYNKPYIKVDPITGIESAETKAYRAGAIKPSFGEGIASNIRFRDGSIYQSAVTKQDGTFAFTELFPFFNWMVAEIDYARFKATGATMIADAGGVISKAENESKLWTAETGSYGSNDPAFAYNPWTRLNPQLQETCTQAQVDLNKDSAGKIIDASQCFAVGPKYFRTENCAQTGGQCATLLEGMQTFLGQTNHIEWGKQPYAGQLIGTKSENGGIAGIVHYAITRAEDDPRLAAAENWEPGIPHVQVNMFLDCDGDGKPDQPLNNGSGLCSALSSGGYIYDQPDVDNYPFCWRDPASCGLTGSVGVKGPEDVKRSTLGGTTFSLGDVFQWGGNGTDNSDVQIGMGATDSWDDNIPSGCVKPVEGPVSNGGIPFKDTLDCFDGLYNFNQLRPAVFDGGYAFGRVAGQPELPVLIGAEGKGTYIIEAVAPPGYLHQGNGDKNVTFGDSLQASTAALPFACVGLELDVPQYLTLFPDANNADTLNPNYTPGAKWNKCDMKAVPLLPGTNPAPDFFMFTEAPVAGHGVGFILDDTATEFNRFAPTFGEKYAPPHLPISIQDWTGREITRAYSDQFGSYNFLVPSSFTINPPFPSGVMPSMMVSCMNHPGPILDERATIKNALGVAIVNPTFGQKIIDPYFNRKYTQFCYTLQYLPGKTTYLDTPVLPIAAFANIEKNPLDCECQDKTPAIYSVNNGATGSNNGPWVPSNPVAAATLVVVSSGANVEVPNPSFDPTVDGSQRMITRDYSFGSAGGTVKLGNVDVTPAVWNKDILTLTVPRTTASGAYQLSITRNDSGKESVVGVTVHVGGIAPKVVQPGASIQAVIDDVNTHAGDLISIPPGTYNEYLILDKRVRLQGWGAGSVTINASKASAGGLAAWRVLLNKKVDARCANADGSANDNASGNVSTGCPNSPIDAATGAPQVVPGRRASFDPLPGQTLGLNKSNNEPILFGAEEGAGILVVGKLGTGNNARNCADRGSAVRIDGLTVTGSDAGGGILASGYNCDLQITNNRVVGNYGTYVGGVRVGHTALTTADGFTDGMNNSVVIDHNWISQNGASEIASGDGGGGGVTLGTGSNGYAVSNNYVCGNFSMSDGGGISHVGRSSGSNTIFHNQILLNQTFNQSADPSGGGLFVGGQVVAAGETPAGTGNVTADRNLIQYNHAGAGAGGGVSIARTVNRDAVLLTNNMIVNNVAAYTGGGVAVSDASTDVRLVNNTVANNASTATNRQSFPAGPKVLSTRQIAGIARLSGSGPTLLNNIVWGNEAYTWSINKTGPIETTALTPAGIWDTGSLGGGSTPLVASNSILSTGSSTTNCTNCVNATDAGIAFVRPIKLLSQTDTDQPVLLPESTVMQTALTFDEGGNFINVNFSPLTPWDLANPSTLRSDYHIQLASVAVNAGANRSGNNRVPTADFDGQNRAAIAIDAGADELPVPAPTLSGISPNQGLRPSSGTANYSVTLTGTNLTGATLTENVNNFGLINISYVSATQITATVQVASNATLGAKTLTVNTAGGSATASFLVVSATPVAVTGGTGQGNLNGAGTTFAFGNLSGNQSTTLTVTMGGSAPVTFGAASVANATGTAFALGAGVGADTCSGTTKNPGDTCTIQVLFNAPTNTSARTGSLSLPYTGAGGSPLALNLTGS